MPFEKSPEQPHLAGERALITESTIALPGCAAVPAFKVFLADEPQEKPNDSQKKLRTFLWHGWTLKAVVKTQKQAACEKPLLETPEGALIEIAVRPSGIRGGERLFLTQFSPSEFETLMASYGLEPFPSLSTEKPKTKKRPRPKETAAWRLIRKDYRACDEGSDAGAVICAAAKLYEADGKLNAEWRQLTDLLPKDSRATLASQQREWLEEVDRKCKHKNEEAWNDR